MKDKTEALFYVQAPYKADLPGDMTYQFQWVPMVQNARGWYAKGIFGTNDLPGKADDWLKVIGPKIPELLARGQQLGFSFTFGQRPTPNAQDPVMYLSEPYPGFTGVFPNYDPTQLNNQGVGTVLRGDEARRERYNNYNVTLRRELPANFSASFSVPW